MRKQKTAIEADEQKIMLFLKTSPKITTAELCKALAINRQPLQIRLSRLFLKHNVNNLAELTAVAIKEEK
jgi:predicted HTH transcriptional regulator